MLGSDMSGIQRFESRCFAIGQKLGLGVGRIRHPRQYHIPRIYRNSHGGGVVQEVPGKERRVAKAKHAWKAEQAGGFQRGGGLLDVACQLVYDGR